MRLVFILILLPLLPAFARGQATSADPPLNWTRLVDDLDSAEYSYRTGTFQGSLFTAFRTSLNKFRVQVLQAADYGKKRMDIRELCRAGRATLCINANFFDPEGQALGLVVSRGILANRLHRGGNVLTGVFFASRQKIGIANRDDLSLEGIIEAVQAGPRLIADGKVVPGLREAATTRRSGVCIDHSGRLIFFTIADSWTQSSNAEVNNLLLAGTVACRDVLNLDGGGSSQLFLEISGPDKIVGPIWLAGRDPVPVALALVPLSLKS